MCPGKPYPYEHQANHAQSPGKFVGFLPDALTRSDGLRDKVADQSDDLADDRLDPTVKSPGLLGFGDAADVDEGVDAGVPATSVCARADAEPNVPPTSTQATMRNTRTTRAKQRFNTYCPNTVDELILAL